MGSSQSDMFDLWLFFIRWERVWLKCYNTLSSCQGGKTLLCLDLGQFMTGSRNTCIEALNIFKFSLVCSFWLPDFHKWCFSRTMSRAICYSGVLI